MRQLTSFLAGLMLMLTALAGTAHAAEIATCGKPVAAGMVMHGDCGQMPGDSDKACPHQHDGCHGQHVSTAARDTLVEEQVPAEQVYASSPIHAMFAYEIARTLRPPKA